MRNETATKVWISTSPEVRKIIEKHVLKTADTLVKDSYDITYDCAIESIDQCIVKILTELKEVNQKLETKPYKLAESLKNQIFDAMGDLSKWETWKNDKIQLERIKILNKIIEKRICVRENLLPDEVRALEDAFTSEDVPEEVRFNTYLEFLSSRIKKLIHDLKFNMYDQSTKGSTQRLDHISELFRLNQDQDILSTGTIGDEEKVINKAWGISDVE